MKAFLIKIKDGLKKTLHSNFFLGVILTTFLFISALIWQQSFYEKKILVMQHDVEVVMFAQERVYEQRVDQLKMQVDEQDLMLERASEVIQRYRQIIENLVKELQKHQQEIDPDKWT